MDDKSLYKLRNRFIFKELSLEEGGRVFIKII